MNTMTSNRLVLFTLIAVVLGILLGLLLPGLMLALAFAGDLFVNVLQILFIPLVGSAIITGVAAFSNQRQIAKAALGTLTLFLGTTIVAIIIGLILTVIIKPGVGINTGAGFIPGEIINAPVTQSLDFLKEILPSNIINAVTHGKFLGWMIVLTIAAAVLGTLGHKARPVTDFFEAVYAVVQKVLGVVVNLVPVGIFFVLGAAIARNSGSFGNIYDGLFKFSLVLLIGFLIHALLVIPAILKFFAKRSPIEYFLNVLPAIKTALASASPTAALPITYENSTERNNIDNRIASLVLPIGSSLNVNGRALYVTVSALFIAQAFDVQLGFLGTMYVAVAALFFSLGTGTLPFVGMLILVSVFDFAGFPTTAYAGIGLIFVIDWFWARIFAALDVWSDTAIAAAVEENIAAAYARPERPHRPDFQRDRRYDSPRGRDSRDYSRPRSRDESRRRDFRPERGPRPYQRPERETIKSEIPPHRPERPVYTSNRPERASASPFELKPDVKKTFSIESVKSEEHKQPMTAPVPATFNKLDETKSDDRSKLREKKQFAHGHDVEKKKPRPRTRRKIVDSKKESPASPTTSDSIAPPPLIREMRPETKEPSPAPPPTSPLKKPDKIEPKETPSDEFQTSLFGREKQKKGKRPKSDTPPKPIEEAESFSDKKHEFGRGARKKKPK